MAMNNNCVGWVQNTKRGTVIGQLQGPPESVKTLKDWLKKTGSPKSRIVRCVFKNEIEIKKLEHSEFLVIK
ncbi:acylphosphatase-1 [Octopus bimaculoides]|nr:acylphosphatase-1 [Octopus bimaculoides]